MFDPTMTFKDLKWVRKNWKGTLRIKGIQNTDDAKKPAEFEADEIILSNHGGRQLDRAPVPLHLLAEVKGQLREEMEVHTDTGIIHGADILAAVALGTQFTYVGRAYLYGLIVSGQAGVERTFEILQSQMIRNMKLLGINTLEELGPRHVRFLRR